MKTYIFRIKTSFSQFGNPIDEKIIGCCAESSKKAFENIKKNISNPIVYSKLIAFCDNYVVHNEEDNYLLEENDVVFFL